MWTEEPPAKPASESRMSLAIITEPGQANAFGTLHGGVMLKLADECGAIAALRHAGKGQITTAAIDSMIFLGPVYVGERVEIRPRSPTWAGRRSRRGSRSSPSRSTATNVARSRWAMVCMSRSTRPAGGRGRSLRS